MLARAKGYHLGRHNLFREARTAVIHAGADAYFDYQVDYPNGEIKKETFTSHYIPWPAKCLIGKEPVAATSTEAIIQE